MIKMYYDNGATVTQAPDGKMTDIGTSRYFYKIVENTIFADINIGSTNDFFSQHMKLLSRNAAKALSVIYEDIIRNKETVKFLIPNEVENIKKLARNLESIVKFESVGTSRTARDIENILSEFRLNSYVTADTSKNIRKEMEKNFSNSTANILDLIIRSGLNATNRVTENSNQKRYLEDLQRRYSKDIFPAIRDVPRFDSLSNRGKSGKFLGTKEYENSVKKDVYGNKFANTSFFNSFDYFEHETKAQIRRIIVRIEDDVKSAISNNEYMDFDTRNKMFYIIKDLVQYNSSYSVSNLTGNIEKMKKLEGFDNKIIVLSKFYDISPVKAKLKWEKGKNILNISAEIGFLFSPFENDSSDPDAVQAVKDRKATTMQGFRGWEGEYTVFNGQYIKVEMDLKEVLPSQSAVNVYLTKKKDSLGAFNTSMSWGGVGIYNWGIHAPKFMILRDEKSYTAMHEFGHTLGLGDAYGGSVFGPGIDANDFPDLVESSKTDPGYDPNNFIMNKDYPARNNDIEMVILAFATGRRQNYQKQFPWDNVSEALGKGN